MLKIIRFYIKIMIKNPIFFLSLIFNTFLLYKQGGSLQISINEFTRAFFFGFICSNLYILIISTYVMCKNYEILIVLEKNIFKKQISVIISSLLISIILLIFPIVTIIIFTNNMFQWTYVLNGIINFTIVWILSNFIVSTIGSSIGIIIKNFWAIILSFLVYSLFLVEVNTFISNPLYKLFNIFNDYTFIGICDTIGQIFNKAYYLDKIFIILVSIFILFVTNVVYSNKKIKAIIGSIIVMFFIILNIQLSLKSTVVRTNLYKPLKNPTYDILTYDMNLKLDKSLENNVVIGIKATKSNKNIKFLLDSIFKVKSVAVNNQEANFKHENDQLEINYEYSQNDKLNIGITYGGEVNLEDKIGSPMYYVNNSNVNLPIFAFYWYPINLSTNTIDFDLNINSSEKLYSNVNLIKEGNYKYVFKGNNLEVNLFSGEYKNIYDNGIEYIIPKNYNLKLFKDSLNDYISNLDTTKFTEKELDNLKNKRFKKIIVAVWQIDIPNSKVNYEFKLVDDTLIINK